MPGVPLSSPGQPVADAVGRVVAEQPAAPGNIRQGMAHIPGPEIPVRGLRFGAGRLELGGLVADEIKKLAKGGALAKGLVCFSTDLCFRYCCTTSLSESA